MQDNFIEVYSNILSNTFCNSIIKLFNTAEESGFCLNRQNHDGASKLNKEDTAFFLPSEITETDFQTMGKSLSQEFNNVFWEQCYKQYAEKYSILNDLDKHSNYTIKIQRTKPGQGYHMWHCEQGTRETSQRLLAWTAYLNDDFEAGETEFLYQQYRYKPSKGDVVIFPAAFTHTHRGNPPIGGDKYIITGWVEF